MAFLGFGNMLDICSLKHMPRSIHSNWESGVVLVAPSPMSKKESEYPAKNRNPQGRVDPAEKSEAEGIRSLQQEVARLKQLLEQQRQSHLRTIHALAAGVWEWSPDTDEAFFSTQFKAILGYTDETHPNSAAFHRDSIHPEDVPRVFDILGKALEAGEPFDVEYRVRKADDSWVWVHSHGLIHEDPGSEARWMMGSIIDVSRRRQLEETLSEHEQQYRDIFEANPLPLFVYDLQTLRILNVNDAALSRYGYDREAFLSLTIKDIRPKEDIARLEENLAHAPVGPESGIWRHQTVDGRLIDVEVHSRPLLYQGRRARLVLANDITARLAAEEMLKLNEERFQLASQATQDVIWDWDVRTDGVQWNDNLRTVFGHVPKEIATIHGGWSHFVHPEDVDAVVSSLDAFVLTNGTHWSAEYRFRRADGTYAHVLDRGYAIRNAEGVVIRMVGAMTDLSERMELETRLRAQAALLDQTRDAILVVSMTRQISYWNHGAERIYGWSVEEACSRGLELTGGADRQRLEGVFAQVVERGVWAGDLRHSDREGQEVVVESRWTLLRDQKGEPEAVLIVNTDVTERRKIEAQFLRSQRVEAIGTLAGGIAHDLNNVLAPILMSIGLLKTRSDDPEILRVLNVIERGGRRGSDMVKQVLSFARGVEGENVLITAKHLFDVIEDAFWESFPKNIRLSTHITASAWPIKGDPTQLHQVLLNLCINARDAMAEGGEITLSAENTFIQQQEVDMAGEGSEGPHLVITVTDTGCGIPEKIRTRIFDPFFTTKEQGKGTGLGLATVMSIVRGHGGFIRLYSEEGHGTTFKLYFPADPVSVETSQKKERRDRVKLGNGEWILLVDDEEAIRLVAEETLKVFGFNVLTAENGEDALSLFVQHQDQVDLVVTDMMMPVMDGPALIHTLRQLKPDIKVIAASGLKANSMVEKVSKMGVRHFLSKPYSTETLIKAIHHTLKGKDLAGS